MISNVDKVVRALVDRDMKEGGQKVTTIDTEEYGLLVTVVGKNCRPKVIYTVKEYTEEQYDDMLFAEKEYLNWKFNQRM